MQEKVEALRATRPVNGQPRTVLKHWVWQAARALDAQVSPTDAELLVDAMIAAAHETLEARLRERGALADAA